MKCWSLELIHWQDAVAETNWTTLKEFEIPDMRCVSVGWVIAEDDQQVTVCQTKGVETEEFNGTITIPKPWIGYRVTLRGGQQCLDVTN